MIATYDCRWGKEPWKRQDQLDTMKPIEDVIGSSDIEVVDCGNGRYLAYDRQGYAKGSPVNPIATRLFQNSLNAATSIYGLAVRFDVTDVEFPGE